MATMAIHFMVSKGWDWNSISVKLSCETNFFFIVESLTMTKMDRLTITQRIKMIKTYYKNYDCAPATYRALRGDYVLHNCPTMKVIG